MILLFSLLVALPSLIFLLALIRDRIQYGVLGANNNLYDKLDIFVPLVNILIPVIIAFILRIFKVSKYRLLFIFAISTVIYTIIIFNWQLPYYPSCDPELVDNIDKGCAFAGADVLGTVIHLLLGYGLLPIMSYLSLKLSLISGEK
jgi:hypothetical protein